MDVKKLKEIAQKKQEEERKLGLQEQVKRGEQTEGAAKNYASMKIRGILDRAERAARKGGFSVEVMEYTTGGNAPHYVFDEVGSRACFIVEQYCRKMGFKIELVSDQVYRSDEVHEDVKRLIISWA